MFHWLFFGSLSDCILSTKETLNLSKVLLSESLSEGFCFAPKKKENPNASSREYGDYEKTFVHFSVFIYCICDLSPSFIIRVILKVVSALFIEIVGHFPPITLPEGYSYII